MGWQASDYERPTLPCPPKGAGPGATDAPAARSREDARRESSEVRVGERRLFFRVRTDLEITIVADSHAFTARSVNLSPGGLLVSTYRALAEGLVVGVEFDLPASRVIAQASVVWSCEAGGGRLPGYGIEFTELTRFDRTLIESFCARLAPEAYPRFASSPPSGLDRRLAG
jgi:uncharacterized protein (TIGR02266 family)